MFRSIDNEYHKTQQLEIGWVSIVNQCEEEEEAIEEDRKIELKRFQFIE